MIDLSNNINSLRREYNTMTHKELDSIYINTNSNIFSADTSFREWVLTYRREDFFKYTTRHRLFSD